jgi:glycosyltransferase involved in cell wall biosynthesis
MRSNSPLVSVVIPVFNGSRFLAEAIESVRSQEYEPLEIIVVDDGSTDSTAEVAARYGDEIRYVFQQNSGAAAARNRGIAEARGEVIAFLDVDDLWPQGKLELQAERLLRDPELDIVSGRVQFVCLPGAAEPDIEFESANQTLTNAYLGAALFRRRVFDYVGLFDTAFRYSDDQDWFLRAREVNARMVILEQTTLLYRLHETNMTRDKAAPQLELARILKRSLERRRAAKPGGEAESLRPWSDHDEAPGRPSKRQRPLAPAGKPSCQGGEKE